MKKGFLSLLGKWFLLSSLGVNLILTIWWNQKVQTHLELAQGAEYVGDVAKELDHVVQNQESFLDTANRESVRGWLGSLRTVRDSAQVLARGIEERSAENVTARSMAVFESVRNMNPYPFEVYFSWVGIFLPFFIALLVSLPTTRGKLRLRSP